MPVNITMPQLGESLAEGTIGKWLKNEGEAIARDEPLVEIITDKVTAEMPSPVAGLLGSIAAVEGETVPVGTTIAVIEEAGADRPSPATDETLASDADRAPVSTGETATTRSEPSPAVAIRTDPGEIEHSHNSERRASPLVRRLAREHGVDVSLIAGTGSGGRVTKQDILAYIDQQTAPVHATTLPSPAASPVAAPAAPASAPAAAPPQSPAHADSGDEVVPLTPIRRSIAEHMVRSVTTAPHAWCLVEVDVTELVRVRELHTRDWHEREGFELTFLPFFVKAVTESLREHRIMNSSWSEAGVILRGRINVGIAVAVEDGLIVPVLHDADRQSIAGLAHGIHDLVTRARQHQLAPADVQGGTFTVNNTGALGSIMSAPIIPQPQAGIVTMEAIVKRPVIREDAIAIRSMMNVCMSFDHRVTDGAQGLRFLQSVRRRLESFDRDTSVF
jgi:2-oxoisovalerate dehydrogenase E2 component (dihydrolipoyl transacylase)